MNTPDTRPFDSLVEDEPADFDTEERSWYHSQPAARTWSADVGKMWGRWGYDEGKAFAERAVTASKMVQSVVNAVARDGRYAVRFDSSTRTAATDMGRRSVVITPLPLEDATLSGDEAARILTAMAAHEVSHPRYGRATAAAVTREFGKSGYRADTAHRLGNILDDVRIERRFAADFPGYASLFDPMLDYVAGPKPLTPAAPTDVAVVAIRYDRHAAWRKDQAAERAWWIDWSERGAREDAPKRHVAFVQEALDHIAAGGAEPLEQQRWSLEQSGHNDGQPGPCAADDINGAARRNGVRADGATLAGEAEAAIQADKRYQPDGIGGQVDVRPSPDGHTSGARSAGMRGDSPAAAAVRNAFVRSRSGHTAVDRRQVRGSLDGRSLDRIAMGDQRLFSRRTAPSPTPLNVWVLVDSSGSMGGEDIREAAVVAHALADASRSLQSVRMTVWGWSDGRGPWATRMWSTGERPEKVFRLVDLRLGGTPDASILSWAWRAILRDTRQGERPIIILASDGFGSGRLPDIVPAGRRHGVDIRGVAIGASVDEDGQRERFGEGGYIRWGGHIGAAARPLADLITRAAAGRRPR